MTERHWIRELPFGLPPSFDFNVVRTKEDAGRLLLALPNHDRGVAAHAIRDQRDRVGNAVAYAALMEAWEHDDRVLVEAFDTMDVFAAALRAVAPPIKRKRPLRVWRGIAVRHAHPGPAAIGLSWTRSRDIACWFATLYQGRADLPGVRPFVFTTTLDASAIIAFHNGRKEQEVIVDPAVLDVEHELGGLGVDDGTGTCSIDLEADSAAPSDVLADWRSAAQRHAEVRS